jgi:hypothetical protein
MSMVCSSRIIGQVEPNSVDSRSEPLNEGCDSPSVFKSGTRWATILSHSPTITQKEAAALPRLC